MITKTLQNYLRTVVDRWRAVQPMPILAGHFSAKTKSLANRQSVDMPSVDSQVMEFVKLTENAFTPTKGSVGAAGYDLCSAYDYAVDPMGNALVKTDLQIAVPHGCYGRIAPRSGLALKHFIDVGAGVVDEDYRGNVGVVLFNFNKEKFLVKKGDRIAQLIIERIATPQLKEVTALSETVRGSDGFGSTGGLKG